MNQKEEPMSMKVTYETKDWGAVTFVPTHQPYEFHLRVFNANFTTSLNGEEFLDGAFRVLGVSHHSTYSIIKIRSKTLDEQEVLSYLQYLVLFYG